MSHKSYVAVFVFLFLLVSNAHSQVFDPYARVSDPRAICRLDGPDTLPVRIFSGVGFNTERNPIDGGFLLAKGTGSGVITHLWLMYYELPADSLISVRIWVDDSLIITSNLYSLFKKTRGALHAPFDSLASGGLNCDVQISYKKNYLVQYYSESSICCLFWAVEYRPILDSNAVESFRLNPSDTYKQHQASAEEAFHNAGAYWDLSNAVALNVPKNEIAPSTSVKIANVAGPGMIQSIHIYLDSNQSAILPALWLRMYWDGSPYPSVNVPLMDFFGCGAGFRNMRAFQMHTTESGSMVCNFPMPFLQNATIELVNTSNSPISFISEIQYSPEPIDRYNQGYFEAQFNETPLTRWHVYHHVGSLLGRGKFIGIHIALPENPVPYYLEGDPYIDIDSNSNNRIHYTGLEDYLTGGWFFSDTIFSLPFAGCTRFYSSLYRFHILDAYDFQKSFNFELEHGSRNEFQARYRTVSLFYRRWTPFWVDRDTIHLSEIWNVGGSGYLAHEKIVAMLDSQLLFSSNADASGHFSIDISIPSSVRFGLHRLIINGYERPEPILVLEKPTVRLMYDSLPHLFRYKDSVMLFGTGFKPGEKVSVFVDTTEVFYLSAGRTVGTNYQWMFPVRLPSVSEGIHRITAKGDHGSIARSDTEFVMTRTINYECENLPIVISEAYTEFHYLGYSPHDNWSNQYARLFYPWEPMKRLELAFIVPVADTFHVSLYNTIGLRYGIYDISLDGEKMMTFNGFFDTGYSLPFRSKELEGGIHYLSKGEHRLSYYCVGADPRGREFLLDADNIILRPTTAFHRLPNDTQTSVILDSHLILDSRLTISPNPLHQNNVQIHVDLSATFQLHSDVLVIEIYDILGREVASVVNGTIGVRTLDLSQDCSKLVAGTYFCRMRVISSTTTSDQSFTFVIDR